LLILDPEKASIGSNWPVQGGTKMKKARGFSLLELLIVVAKIT
jgi:hypothetical protein